MNYPVKHSISLAALLNSLWLVLSGQFHILVLSLGIAATLFIVYIANRMDVRDR